MIKPKVSKQEWQELVAAKVAAAQEVLMREVASSSPAKTGSGTLVSSQAPRLFAKQRGPRVVPTRQSLCRGQGFGPRADLPGRIPHLAGARPQHRQGPARLRRLGPGTSQPANSHRLRWSIRRMAKDEQQDPGETESSHQEIRGFTVEHVFDVSQTHGDPLPSQRGRNCWGEKRPRAGPGRRRHDRGPRLDCRDRA